MEIFKTLEQTCEALPDGVIVLDDRDRVIHLNTRAARMLGLSRDQILARPFQELPLSFFTPGGELLADGAELLSELKRGAETGVCEKPCLLERADGERLLITITSSSFLEPGSGSAGLFLALKDLTEEQARVQEILESEERYRSLVESLPVAVFIFQDYKVKFANRAAAEIFGYPAPEDIVGRDIMTPVAEEDRPRLERYVEARLRGEPVPEHYEATMVRTDGTRFPAEVFVKIVKYKGRPAHQAAILDLSPRKQWEENLVMIKEAVESTSDAVIITDLQGRSIYHNPAAVELLGYSESELTEAGGPAALYQDKELAGEIYHKVRKGEKWSGELAMVAKHGQPIPMHVRVSPIKNPAGLTVGLLGIGTDITELKVARDMLLRSEQEKETIMNAVREHIIYYGEDTRVAWANHAAAASLGMKREEILGRHCYELWHGRSSPCPDCPVQEARRTGLPQEREVTTPDGRIWQIRGYPVLDERGGVKAAVEVTLEITEKKKAEQALRESEERFRLISEEITDGVAFTVDGKNVWVNRAFAEIFGYEREELLGKGCEAVIAPEELPRLEENMARRLAGEAVPSHYEARARKKDGTPIIIEVSAKVVDPEKRAIQVVVRDITERKKALEELARSEERYRLLFNVGRDARFIHGVDESGRPGRFLEVNDAACKLLGYTKEELLGLTPYDITDMESPGDIPSFGEELLRTGQVSLEGEMIRKDGSRVPVELDAYLFEFRGEPAVLSIVRDITERKEAEEALRRSEELYRTLVETLPLSVSMTDMEGKLIYVSPQTLQIHGTEDPDELLGKSAFQFFAEGEGEKMAGVFRELLEKGSVRGVEYVSVRKDGSKVIQEMNAALVRNSQGEPIAIIGSSQDITERKKIEEELMKADKLESLGILAGGLAHDFNNILTAILGNISYARFLIGSSGEAADRLEQAERACFRAKDLTQQLLTFSKGGAPALKTASVSDLLRDTASFALRGAKSKLEFQFQPGLWPAKVDEAQFAQVINNLVINADQAMPGGGTITIRAENYLNQSGTETGPPLPEGRYIKITVSDQGVGIPKEILGKIFDPFFSTKQTGSGLGLAIVYSIVKRHGGHVEVKSEPGRGTSFVLYFPASDEPLPVPEAEKEVLPEKGEGRILLMDDEDALRELVSASLQDRGYEVHTAERGEEAIEMCRKAKEQGKPYDVVILDLTVRGGMGGKEALKEIKKILPRVKSIVTSGYATDPVLARHKEYGFDEKLAKPFRPDDLHRLLLKLK